MTELIRVNRTTYLKNSRGGVSKSVCVIEIIPKVTAFQTVSPNDEMAVWRF